MALIRFLNKKPSALIIFLFSWIALGLFILSSLLAVTVCRKWYGLIIGGSLMLLAIPFHCSAKYKQQGYLISFLLTSVANGFSVSAYYLSKCTEINIDHMLLAAIPASIILLLVCTILLVLPKSKIATITTSCLLTVFLMVGAVVLWIRQGGAIFSFGFSCLLISLFYLAVFGLSVNHLERLVLRDISFGSFGSFIILSVVVIFILSGGDILDGADAGIDFDTKNNKKRKAK